MTPAHAVAHILLLSGDSVLARLLAEQMEAGGEFRLDVLTDPAALDGRLARNDPVDVVICDRRSFVPATAEGSLRAHGRKVPLLVLGAADSGPADYPLPLRYGVIAARLRATVRSHARSDDAQVAIGPYTFHAEERLLATQDGTEIRLTDKEAQILRRLHRAGAEPVSRETLLEEVWGYQSGITTHTLETHIYRLRQKIEPAAGVISILLTEAGGYRLAPAHAPSIIPGSDGL